MVAMKMTTENLSTAMGVLVEVGMIESMCQERTRMTLELEMST